MKRTVLLIVLAAFCVLLPACGNTNSKDVQESPPLADSSHVQVAQPPADSVQNFQTEAGYPYGNMQKNIPSGNFARYGDTVLFSHSTPSQINNSLYSYDMNTGKVSLFCKDATCSHISKDCAAYGADDNLEQYGGNVYASHLNGAVLELKNGKFEPVTEEGISHFWHSGGNLYVATKDSSLIVYEQGSSKPKMLIEEYTGYWETVFDGVLYYSSSYNVNRVDLNSPAAEKDVLIENADYITDGEFIYYAPEKTLYLYRCDMQGNNSKLLLEKPILPASWNFDEEFFYFRLYTDNSLDGADSNVLYRFPKDDPSRLEKISELDTPIASVYTVPGYEKIFVIGRAAEDGTAPIYVMNRDGSNEKLLELPEF